jgi:hypothetical protein
MPDDVCLHDQVVTTALAAVCTIMPDDVSQHNQASGYIINHSYNHHYYLFAR